MKNIFFFMSPCSFLLVPRKSVEPFDREDKVNKQCDHTGMCVCVCAVIVCAIYCTIWKQINEMWESTDRLFYNLTLQNAIVRIHSYLSKLSHVSGEVKAL